MIRSEQTFLVNDVLNTESMAILVCIVLDVEIICFISRCRTICRMLFDLHTRFGRLD